MCVVLERDLLKDMLVMPDDELMRCNEDLGCSGEIRCSGLTSPENVMF